MKTLRQLEQACEYDFHQPELLKQALTHRSYGLPHNERLEFLGDALLNCAVSWLLFERFPELPEGQLSRARANLVNEETLVKLAQGLELADGLQLGKGEEKSGGRHRPSILADTFEALIGAIYLDSGDFTAVLGLISKLYMPLLMTDFQDQLPRKDAKTVLQEWQQSRKLPLPQYQILDLAGKLHHQQFTVCCTVVAGQGAQTVQVQARGTGVNRRQAEQAAATKVLEQLWMHFPKDQPQKP